MESAFALTRYSATAHFVAATGLFAFLAYYSLFVFTRKKNTHWEDIEAGRLTAHKRARNDLYVITGIVIICCMLAIAIGGYIAPDAWRAAKGTFICEALALIMFGFAWLVKGKLFGMLDD